MHRSVTRHLAPRVGVVLASLFIAPAVAQAVPGPGAAPRSAPAAPQTSASEAPSSESNASGASDAVPAWVRNVDMSGGIALYYYQPTNGWQNLFLVYTRLRFDARFGAFGLRFEPRLSNEKMRSYYPGLAWVQEAYVYAEADPFILKVGKLYKQSGLFWDNSFYGNIQVYEGLKFDPNSGFSLEAKFGERVGAQAYAQFFVADGRLNASLAGRDTVSIPGASRRNIFAGRLAPFAILAKDARLDLGFSGERFTAELPPDSNTVWRIAADAKLTWGGFGMWGEALHQSGANVNAYPYPGDPAAEPPIAGRASADNTYLLAGAEYTLGCITARYNLSIARYGDLHVQEVLHLPGLGLAFNDHFSFLAEYAVWNRFAPEGVSDVDHSLNLTWMGHF